MVIYSSIITSILIFTLFKYYLLRMSSRIVISALMNDYDVSNEQGIKKTTQLFEEKVEHHVSESKKGNRDLIIKLKEEK